MEQNNQPSSREILTAIHQLGKHMNGMEQRQRDEMHLLNERMNNVEHGTRLVESKLAAYYFSSALSNSCSDAMCTTVNPCRRALANVDNAFDGPPETSVRNTVEMSALLRQVALLQQDVEFLFNYVRQSRICAR